MKDVYEVLQQKEADAANVRHEIQSLKLVCSLLPGEDTELAGVGGRDELAIDGLLLGLPG